MDRKMWNRAEKWGISEKRNEGSGRKIDETGRKDEESKMNDVETGRKIEETWLEKIWKQAGKKRKLVVKKKETGSTSKI